MDLHYSHEEEAFRSRTREWIEQHMPSPEERGTLEGQKSWQRALHEAGFLGATWPREYGGGGLSGMQQAIVNQEMARASAPTPIGHFGMYWVGPAIIRYGSEEQKTRFVRRILSGEDIWATGYSEPNAGSDMWNTQTRAVQQGDDYVINGQKVWTTQAHEADWYFLLVRTSSEGHKVEGLSIVLVPMNAPGVVVRPIRQIAGDSEFNEVFLEDVRVGADALLGQAGQGYEIVSSALVNERSGFASMVRFDRVFERLLETARRVGVNEDPVWRQRLARLAIRTEVIRVAGLRTLSDQLHGRVNPHLSAAVKLLGSTVSQDLSEAGVDIEGPYGRLIRAGESAEQGSEGSWGHAFLRDRGGTIGGGTSEIQRNIIAERILGLPRR